MKLIKTPSFINQHETFSDVIWNNIPYVPPVDAHGLPMPAGVAASVLLKNKKIRKLRRTTTYEPVNQL